MSVEATGSFIEDGRVVPGLENGVKPFTATTTITGDGSGGYSTQYINFNPTSSRTFQPYVAIYEISFVATTADPTDPLCYRTSSHWEDANRSGHGGQIVLASMVTENVNAQWTFIQRQWTYLGRVQQGTPGSIIIRDSNVNTSVQHTYIRGLISDRPFFIPSNMAV